MQQLLGKVQSEIALSFLPFDLDRGHSKRHEMNQSLREFQFLTKRMRNQIDAWNNRHRRWRRTGYWCYAIFAAGGLAGED
jgi:hypothetical protein